jgi:hypothetical protein
MDSNLLSEEQARAALERAIAEGRIKLTPQQEEELRRRDEERRKPWNRVRRILFPRPGGHW